MYRKIEISHRTIIFTAVFLLVLWILYIIRDIILQLFIALLIMAILNPLVSKLSKRRIPRALSVFLVYFIFFGIIGTLIGVIIPIVISQSTSFVNSLPRFFDNLGVSRLLSEQMVGQLISQLGGFPGQVVKVGVSIFSNIFDIFAVLIFAFYFLLMREKLDDHLGFFFGEEKRQEIARLINILEKRLGSWARGELMLMALVGTFTYLGLLILGIPFALPLALLAGVLEIIPYIGPIIAAIPAVLVGLSISPLMGLAVASLAFLIQQFENYLFVPKVMEKSVGVSPIITLVALVIGLRLAGVVGIIVSVPLVITLQVLGKQYLLKD